MVISANGKTVTKNQEYYAFGLSKCPRLSAAPGLRCARADFFTFQSPPSSSFGVCSRHFLHLLVSNHY